MWICLNNAFLSIVNTEDKNKLVVRARKRDHLTNTFPGCEVVKLPKRDYKYRAFIDRTEVAMVIAKNILNIDYDNFKDSVEDDELHDAYKDIWGIMYGLQQSGYGNWMDQRTYRPSSRVGPRGKWQRG